MRELRAKAHGRVQGVGFRAATLVMARELSLSGWVHNASDGSVLILAQGEEENLKDLLLKLEETFSCTIQSSFHDAVDPLSTFSVR